MNTDSFVDYGLILEVKFIMLLSMLMIIPLFEDGIYTIYHSWWSWSFNHGRSIEGAWFMWIRHNWTWCSIFWSSGRWSSNPGLTIVFCSFNYVVVISSLRCLLFAACIKGCCHTILGKGNQLQCDFVHDKRGKITLQCCKWLDATML